MSTAVYMLTLTFPAEYKHYGAAEDVWDAFRKRVSQAKPMRFLRTVERTKKGTIHFHLVVFADDDDDPLVWREEWPYLSDIRLVSGSGWPLDNHISSRRNAHLFPRERRCQHDTAVGYVLGTPDVEDALPRVRYVAKYITKTLVLPSGVQSFRASNGWGSPHKVILALTGHRDPERCKRLFAELVQDDQNWTGINATVRTTSTLRHFKSRVVAHALVSAGLDKREFMRRRFSQCELSDQIRRAYFMGETQ